MAKYSGKDEKINGKWYPVTVKANTLKEAINKLYVGQQKSYGTVQAIRGRSGKRFLLLAYKGVSNRIKTTR